MAFQNFAVFINDKKDEINRIAKKGSATTYGNVEITNEYKMYIHSKLLYNTGEKLYNN